MVTDDEPLVRLAMEETFEEGGFHVVGAPSAEATISILEGSEVRFAALITDIKLGDGMDGWALARRARELIPEICVLYVTGDSSADWPAFGVPGSMVLQKPVADAHLLASVATILNERGRVP